MGVSCSCEGPSVVFPQHNLRVVRSKGQNRMSSPRGGGGGPAEEEYANRPPTTHIFTQPTQISEDSTFLSFHHIGTAGSVVASNPPPPQQQQQQHQQHTSASLNIPQQQQPLGSDTDSVLLNTTGQLRFYASCASSFASGGSQRAIANQLDSRSSHTTTSYGGGIRNPLVGAKVTNAARSQLLPSDPWSSLCSRTSSDLTAVRQSQPEAFAEENKQRMVPADEGNKRPSVSLEASQEGPPHHLQLAVGMPTNQFTGDSSSMCCDSTLGSPYDTGVHPSDAFVGSPTENNF